VNARRAWIWIHKWTGLIVGAHFALLGITGSIIVFYRELDVALNPALFAVNATASPRLASEILRAAQAAAASPVEFLFVPDHVQPVWIALWRHDGQFRATNIDPGTGTILGTRVFGESVALTIYRLHSDLLLKDWWGEEVVGVAGFILLLSAGTGLYLWWPRRTFWRALVTMRPRPRQILYLDLHNLLGAWSSIVFLIVAFTGVAIVFPGLLRSAIGTTSPVSYKPAPEIKRQQMEVDIDRVLQIAVGHMPGAEPVFIYVARLPKDVWRVGLRPHDENSGVRSTAEISIDGRTGDVVDDRTPAALTLGERFMTAQLWIHNGAMFGWPGRVLVLLSGLTLPGAFITGLLLWLRKRSARRALDKRRKV
jgi:uncharacterized iron-regulated membrane protein